MDLILALVVAAASALFGVLAARYWPSIERTVFGRRPVRATIERMPAVQVQTDPGIFEAGFPNWEPYGFVFPDSTDVLGDPPSDICRDWQEWARSSRAVDAGWTKVQVIVEAQDEGTVVIDDLVVDVVIKQPALTGTHAACVPGGATASPREIVIDLDADPPSKRFVNPGDEPTTDFLFTLSPGETETFRLFAVADHFYCEWTARLHYVSHGIPQYIDITDHGHAFRTTGTRNAKSYAWIDGRWSDDFFTDSSEAP